MAVTALTVEQQAGELGGVARDPLRDGGGRAATASPSDRVLAATITCLGRWGLSKTTLDDIAREAGCSRATVYRLFPGGKDTVVAAATAAELERVLGAIGRRATAAGTLEDLLVAVFVDASRVLRDHAALQYLLAHEPDQVLPHLAFGRFDALLGAAVARTAPWLEPHLGIDGARRGAEWVLRLLVSHGLAPSEHVDLTDEADARRFARTFLLPGLRKAT